MEKPKRRYEMTFTIGADSFKHLLRAMDEFVMDMDKYHIVEQELAGGSGGPDVGYHYKMTYNPEMTHERYHELLRAYLDEMHANEREADA